MADVPSPAAGGPLVPSPAAGDPLLPADVAALQREASRFAIRLREEAARREWQPDPADRVPWPLVAEASRRGWRTLGLPRNWGGGGASVLALCALVEALAWGDMGFAVLIDQTLKVERILARLAGPQARRHFLDRFLADDRCVLAICLTEPETGSDYVIPSPGFRFRTTAARRPDGSWVLDGTKRFISNGADARFAVVFACTDASQPAERGTSAFLVERGLPGYSTETVHEKISQRTINNAVLRFDRVAVEPWRLLGRPHLGFAGAREILRESVIEAAATTLGTARAAYEMALRHACQRRQGGRPLAEHGNVRARLGRMHAQLEAARSLVWRAAAAVESDGYDHRLGASAKLVAADAAVAVCQSAMELHGGLAVMYRECGVEKCLRDCLSFLHSDGAQDSLALRIADLSVAALRDG
jgi:alkylation response protein AidB-like acyl-CoA dehydrogenase